MSGRVPDCRVTVNGKPVQHAKPTAATAGDPMALDGLRVTWGRETTVDQPDPAMLSMTLLDPPGGASFGAEWHVGALVVVEATGPQWTQSGVPGDPGYGPSTVTYGDFEAPDFDYGRHVITDGGAHALTMTRSTAAPYRGQAFWHMQSERVRGTDGDPLTLTNFLPGPRAMPGDPPGSWDAIPRFGSAASRWRLRCAYRAWHVSAVLAPLLVSAPNQSGGMTGAATGSTELGGTGGAWVAHDVVSTLQENRGSGSSWLGLTVRLEFPTWAKRQTLAETWAGADCTWAQAGAFDLDDLAISPDVNNPDTDATVIVFEGRVTDLALSVDDWDRPTVKVTAADVGAELRNRVIGDEPWGAETVAARAARILAASGGDLTLLIDPALRQTRVSYQDVDAQDTLGLLHALASSVDGVLWVATHPTIGTYLRMEALTTRAPLFRLDVGTDGLLRIVPSAGERVLTLSACEVLTEPVQFETSVSDVVNTVAVTWREQTKDEQSGKPAPTERTIMLRDATMIAALGTRRMSIQTVLADLAPAQALASQLLGRLGVADWRVSGLTIDVRLMHHDRLSVALRLLDGTARNGLPLFLTDLPAWAPAANASSLYLEGGSYTYAQGEWLLDLTASAAQAIGTATPWRGLGTYPWSKFAPVVTWQDMAGVQSVTAHTDKLTYDRKALPTWA